jgi:outer membrane murein-binding lipoprotein Lpp
MLSHLVGAARRADACRVHELEVVCGTLDGKLAQLKHDHRAVLEDRSRLEDELAAQRRELDRTERRFASARDRVAALESQTFASNLEARIAELEQELEVARSRASAAEAALSDTRTRLDETRARGEHSAGQIRELTAENDALEQESASEGGGLCGKRILCVGGRSSLVQYYRALVERRGGEFLHHDGGVEESLDAVTRALATVDAVFCPVDCVSHAACLKVKKACKHLAKQFIPLRSSGLSSFARGIRTLASP